MSDPLAALPSGEKPKQLLADGESVQVSGSSKSKSKYTIKRTDAHYHCSCPAWRNQKGAKVEVRTCKHLKELLGEAYEIARTSADKAAPKPINKAQRAKKTDSAPSINSSASRQSARSMRSNKRKAPDDDEPPDDQGKQDENILGEEYEAARAKLKNPHGSDASSSKDSRPTKRAKKDTGSSNGNGGNGAKVVPQLLLAVKWDLATGCDPTGWWMSEKLDGVRVYYDGKKMWSRLGNPFTPPQEFLDRLPKDVTLDGELFGGRGKFQDTVSIVKTVNSPHWKNITFQIFDIPSRGSEPFEERVAYLKKSFQNIPQVNVVEQILCKSKDHLLKTLKDVERDGGEGIMLRQPGSEYEGKRSSSLLKVKTFYDGEAEVIGYEPGKGKHKGVTGALKCVMASGKKFSVGSGLTDKQRRAPPKVGSIVTYRFQELTRDGVPRFPTFVGIAIDKDKPSDPPVPDNHVAADNED
ncbi:hypothetical protein FRC11_003089 [Ceratobasidium sp. 423]|nr:hypothetical protein FRC11_003089 [Ceratobasidium sp. 423]